MTENKLTKPQRKFLEEAAMQDSSGRTGAPASPFYPPVKALCTAGLIEQAGWRRWENPRWRPTAAGYAAIGLGPPGARTQDEETA